MKAPRALFASLIGLVFIFSGCGSFISDVRDEVNGELFGSDDSYDYYSDNSYDSAVSSLNNYSDLINNAYDEMDYLEYDLYYYTDDLNYYDPGTYEPYFECIFDVWEYDNLKSLTDTPSSEIEETERQWLIAQADAIFEKIDSIDGSCTELGRYVTAHDYKDDNFARSEELVSQLYADIDAYYILHNEMVEKLKDLYSIHENFVVDYSNPVSVGIGNMKIDMNYVDEIFDLLDDAYDTNSFDRRLELQVLYEELLASGEAHAPDPGINDSYVLDYYEYFYDDLMNSFLPSSKRALRAFTDGSWDELDSAYWDMSDYYDFLIDDYNTYLDMAGY